MLVSDYSRLLRSRHPHRQDRNVERITTQGYRGRRCTSWAYCWMAQRSAACLSIGPAVLYTPDYVCFQAGLPGFGCQRGVLWDGSYPSWAHEDQALSIPMLMMTRSQIRKEKQEEIS